MAERLQNNRLHDYIADSERTLLADESAAIDAIDSNFAKRAAKFDLVYLIHMSVAPVETTVRQGQHKDTCMLECVGKHAAAGKRPRGTDVDVSVAASSS